MKSRKIFFLLILVTFFVLLNYEKKSRKYTKQIPSKRFKASKSSVSIKKRFNFKNELPNNDVECETIGDWTSLDGKIYFKKSFILF